MSWINAPRMLFWFLSCVLMAAGAVSAQTTFYVDADATGPTHDGSTWCTAYLELTDALDVSAGGDTIQVADGMYAPNTEGLTYPREATFQLINGVTIMGGYAGCGAADPDGRDVVLYETILSGDLDGDDVAVFCTQDSPDCDAYGGMCSGGSCIIRGRNNENSYQVVTGSGTDATAVLDGFIITAGNANGDGWPLIAGGGMFNDFGGPTVNDCTFRRNSTTGLGGGMYTYAANPKVTNCTFTVNAADFGAGMYNYEASPHVSNCVISGNSAMTHGGGMYNYNGAQPMVTNCTFSGNSADSGAGMYNSFSQPIVTNCIFWNDLGIEIVYDSFPPIVTYSDVQGGTGEPWFGMGCVDADPLFMDADGPDDVIGNADDNLRLMAGSPAVDAGSNSPPGGLPVYDLDGHERMINDIVDLGAFERGPYVIYVDEDNDGVLDTQDVCCNTPPEIAVDGEGRPRGDIDLDCDVDLDDYRMLSANLTGSLEHGTPCPQSSCSSDAD
ncbi:MAG: right-handed parallel beta-helix repeat-containing protein, partial [Planctomycetota bacterium]